VNPSVDRIIGLVAKAGLIVVALALALVMVGAYVPSVGSQLLRHVGQKSMRGYVAGERIDLQQDRYSASPFTLILFARSNCGACQRALSSLRQLHDSLPPGTKLIIVTPTGLPEEPELRYAEAIGLTARDVYRVDPFKTRARSTPTLVLVDKSGRIRFVREGMSAEKYAEVSGAILRASATDVNTVVR
jgi:hypothetical protein